MEWKKYEDDLTDIFKAAVSQVDPEAILLRQLSVSDNILKIKTPLFSKEYNLSLFKRIWVLGAGKASARMAKGLEAVLGNRIEKGIISVKYGHTEKLDRIRIIESGHPVPDENSMKSAKEIAALAKEADSETLVINLISGGGSALLSLPWTGDDFSLTLEEKQQTTKILLDCGADILEINCIRKHISGIKGGRLAQLLYPAACISLILSDVTGDRLDTIASGLTVADSTTYADTYAIFEKYRILDKLPVNVKHLVTAGKNGLITDTPKTGDRSFERIDNILIGNNRIALIAAEKRAAALGYNTIILSSAITGEAREIAKFYSGLCRDTAVYRQPVPKPACILAGGETTVTIRGSGKGGRNQEMALSFLGEIAGSLSDFSGIYFLSAGTDGNDGPTDAAGAFACLEILESGKKKGIAPAPFLAASDSYNYFRQAGGLLLTGPTNTNVCDVQIMLIV